MDKPKFWVKKIQFINLTQAVFVQIWPKIGSK